jgi:ribosomal protein S18 acetylase RimI-like enzyme
MNIVRANIDDIDNIAVLFDAYRQFYECEPDLAKAKQYLTARFMNDESIIFVAKQASSELVGFVQLYPTFCSVDGIKILVLYDLFVASQNRRRGVARSLMDAAREYAKCEGVKRLELSTGKHNLNAQSLYESLGYERDTEFYVYSLGI